MKKNTNIVIFSLVMLLGIVTACSTQKNTAQSRWWHSFTARYNTYYNGAQAYIDASLEKERGNKDNFTEMIPLYIVGNKQSRELGKSNYETAITKSQKAIKQHSIKKRPEWTKNRKKTERDIEWLNRREYNPFIWKAWMLMGRSQFYKGNFDEAAATFSYMSRLFRTQPAIYGKSRAWLAKCYIEQNWLYDAEDVIRNMHRDSIDWRAQKEWDYTMADYYVHLQDWGKAAEFLRKVIKHERRAIQRAREWYLLGQVLSAMKDNNGAYRAFKKVVSQNPPYELEFNARIAMTEVMPSGHSKQKISKLKSMARSDKNKEYLDQVYYAMGNVYLSAKDTLNAIGAYELGNEKATRSGIEKGVLLLHLGDLYWQMERFSDAKRCYGEAIGLLDKEREDYAQLSERSKMLDELVPYTEAVHLQDSLQALAKMSEKDRNAAIDRVIEALKKKEKEEKKKQQEMEAQEQMAKNGGNNINKTPAPPTLGQQQGAWYFYNPMAVQQGKQTFRQQWGTRENADNWQRINKTVVSMNIDNEALDTDSLDADGNPVIPEAENEKKEENDSIQNDPHKREYYLAQIPFTEEQLIASNAVLADGLFHSGVIFKDKLDNLKLSEKNLLRLTDTFSNYEKNDEALYHLFLLYSRKGNHALAEAYLNRMKQDYAESQWTEIITDPYFRENALYGTHLEDSLYAETYEAFKTDNHAKIKNNCELSEHRFSTGQHRDKFLFIGGLSKLNQGDATSCIEAMRKIVKDYPQSEVAGIAGMIVKGVDSGRRMHGTKFDIGSLWDRRSAVMNNEEGDSTKQFSAERITDFVYLMTYHPDSINTENQLLYELARYNFTNYLVRNFDIEIEEYEGLHRLAISGFRNFAEALQYTRQLYKNERVAKIASGSRNIIISAANIALLGTHFSYNDYDEFYAKHFAPMPVPKELLLNDQVIDSKMYDPEEQPLPKKEENIEDENTISNDSSTNIIDIDIEETAPYESAASTTMDITTEQPVVTEVPSEPTTIIDDPLLPYTSTEIIVDDPKAENRASSASSIDISNEVTATEGATIRQQINNEIIDIIDEDTNIPAPPASSQQDDDEYFDLDGF